MNAKKLHDNIQNNNYLIKDETITEQIYFYQIDLRDLSKLEFHNCVFEDCVGFQTIINNNFEIKFHNCSFSKTLDLVNCQLKSLQISFIKQIERITISGKYQKLHIDSNKQPIPCVIDIKDCIITKKINCSNLYISSGQFTLSLKNVISDRNNFLSYFNNSVFQSANFSGFLGVESDFKNFTILETVLFNSDFKKVNFRESDFGQKSIFLRCDFLGTTLYNNIKNIYKTELFFKL